MSARATQAPTVAPHDAESQRFCLTTEQFAARHGIKAQSLRVRLSKTGHYFGVRPLKLANRRVLWPDVIARA